MQHEHQPAAPPSAQPGGGAGFFSGLFEPFVPRQVCMNHEQGVIWLHAVSDTMIALAYFSIPVALLYFVSRRRDLAFHWMFLMFAAFILACGTTHAFNVAALWRPMYRLDGLVKLVTGMVSVLTAILLWPLIPRAVLLPSPSQLREANEGLERANAELAAANAELQQMRDELEQRVRERTAALAHSEEKYRTLFENANDGIFIIDPETLRILDANPTACERLGYGCEELRGRPLSDISSPESPLDLAVATERLRRDQSLIVEHVHRRKDGSDLPVEISARMVRYNGQRVWQSFVRDISERRRAEAHRDELIAELNHRVKNTLATVLSIAQQTLARAPSVESFRQSFEGRIQALSLTHRLLSETHWQHTRLRDLVAACTRPFVGDAPDRLSIEADREILLRPRATLSLTMILHELATNSAKYGAWSGPTGVVAVSWTIERESEPTLRVVWQESGGPPVAAERTLGFGTRFISRSIEYELQGRAEFQYRRDGLRCELSMPAAFALAGYGEPPERS